MLEPPEGSALGADRHQSVIDHGPSGGASLGCGSPAGAIVVGRAWPEDAPGRAAFCYDGHTEDPPLRRDEPAGPTLAAELPCERKRDEEALRQSEARVAAAGRELLFTIDAIPALAWS